MTSRSATDPQTPVLVDSNVILDIATSDARWSAWSGDQLAAAADRGTLVINPIVYAEVSIGYERIEEVEAALPAELYRREALPFEAGFLAGKCYRIYRKRGGARRSPLPDFYVGAHAAIAGYRLLTRDARRYRAYFPTVQLIAPS
ncbi:MAG TPA: type II toxin-antitoxin system VapC family toxin [Polyangiaceae bacterium]